MGFAFKFGTAGIRARAGEAESELNANSVRVIADAIVRRLKAAWSKAEPPTLCVAFDGRRDSRSFADEMCAVALGHGFRVQRFEHETPTPVLAFALRRSGALAGIMITASHNPPEDNGIKLYAEGGRQISAPLDREIEALIAAHEEGAEIPRQELAQARAEGRLSTLGEAEIQHYLDALQSLVKSTRDAPLPRLSYSAMCGVGTPVARAIFARSGANDVVEVREQALPRADFGGLLSPNPEEPSALALLRETAERTQSALAIAHDPDADRLALMAREADGQLRSLSGDEVGALLGDFLLSLQRAPERCLLVSTLVSGGLLERIAERRGAHFLRTPTGFKWIAKLGRERAQAAALDLLFGYEEALGYAFFELGDDKDGCAALHVVCELARRLHARGQTLLGRLAELEAEHGAFATRPLSVAARGQDGPQRIAEIMRRFRAESPETLLGPGAQLEDFERAAPPLPLLVLRDPHGTRVCVRPSGTEPKLKLYLHAMEPAAGDLSEARQRARQRLVELETKLKPYLTV